VLSVNGAPDATQKYLIELVYTVTELVISIRTVSFRLPPLQDVMAEVQIPFSRSSGAIYGHDESRH
jgi:hypothetical protein